MPVNRPRSTHRRLMWVIALAVLLVSAAAPAVSASDFLINENFVEYSDTGGTFTSSGGGYDGKMVANTFRFRDISQHSNVGYIILESSRSSIASGLTEGRNEGSYTLNGITKPAVIYLDISRNFLGQITNYKITVFPDDWNVAGMSGDKGLQVLTPSGKVITLDGDYKYKNALPANQPFWFGAASGYDLPMYGYKLTVASSKIWKNNLLVTSFAENSYKIDLTRVIDNYGYASTLTLKNSNGDTIYQDTSAADDTVYGLQSEISIIEITSGSKTYVVPLSTSVDTPDSNIVTVYVCNSQTGALLADAHLSILAAAGGTETEVVNATLPGGTGIYTLQPTGGGLPNPDYYRAVATVPGFTQIIENHSFTLNGPHDVIIEMRPDTGGPADPERAYLEFYVRDLNANPIPAASIQCGGRILQTNSAGYAVFEVSKNSTHPWIAKKSGYVTIEGTATVGPNPRYVVNVVLGPGTVPTNPPATDPGGPGATPTPTPTGWGPGQWTPDPDESLGDNARGAAKQTLLEGLQAGQLLFTLCILVLIMAVLDSRRR